MSIKTTPFFSIVVPLYNKEAYILDTLSYISTQTCQDFELIIIDDVSTDKGLKLLNTQLQNLSFQYKVQVLQNDQNRGVSFSRNRGIEVAKGQYVLFLDADDLWATTHLEVLQTAMLQYPNESFFATAYTSFIGSDTDLIFTDLTPKIQIPIEVHTNPLASWSKMQHLVHTGSVAVKREVFSKIGNFRIVLKNFQDTDLWIRLALQYPLVYVSLQTIAYRTQLSDSLSARKKDVLTYRAFLEFYKEEEVLNTDLKYYLDQNRFAMLLELKSSCEDQLKKEILQGLDKKHLNSIQKVLLRCPSYLIDGLKHIKLHLSNWGITFKIYG